MKVGDSGLLAWVRGQDESSNGHVWAAGFHHVTAHSRLARIFKLMNCLFLLTFFFFFFLGCSKPQITETAYTGSVDTGAQLYSLQSGVSLINKAKNVTGETTII
jgi:hypothetical protein